MRPFISRQPVMFFLLATFVFSWFFWGISPLFEQNDESLTFLMNIVGLQGPSFVALIITLLLKGKPLLPDLKAHLISFIVVLSIFLFALNQMYEYELTALNIFLTIIVSDLIAYILSVTFTQRYSGHMFRSLFSKNLSVVWTLFALIVLPLVILLGDIIYSIAESESLSLDFAYGNPLLIIFSLLFFAVVGGAVGQEFGWRGFLLPKLFQRMHPLLLGMMLGLIISIWMAPLYFNDVIDGGMDAFLTQTAWNLPLSILIIWTFIRSKGSLFVTIILNASISFSLNTMLTVELSDSYGLLVLLFLVISISFFDPLLRKKQEAFFYLKDRSDLFF